MDEGSGAERFTKDLLEAIPKLKFNFEVAGVQFYFRSTLSGVMPSRKQTQFLPLLFSLTLLVFLTACDSSPSAMDEAPSAEATTEANDPGSATAQALDRSQGNTGCGIGNLNSFISNVVLPERNAGSFEGVFSHEIDDVTYNVYDLADNATVNAMAEETNGAGITFRFTSSDLAVENDIVIGTDGPDNVRSRAGTDCVFGQGGDDFLRADGMNDYIRGGKGNDTIKVTGKGGENEVSRLFGDDGNDVIASFQRGVLEMHGGEGDDELYGGALDDYLYGGPGDDVLKSDAVNIHPVSYPAGNDRLQGGPGADKLDGGPGGDRYIGFDVGDTITDSGTPYEGRDLLRTFGDSPRVEGQDGAAFDAFAAGIENFILNYNGGNIDARRFNNLSDEDAQALADDPSGWANNRRGFLIRLASYANTSKGGPDAKLEFRGTRFRDLVGTVRSDTDDEIFGGAGDDRLKAGAGNDRLDGGDGDDRLYGQDGEDRIFGASGADILYGGPDKDVLGGGRGDDEIHGNEGDDRLNGNPGVDVLQGGDGDDKLSLDADDLSAITDGTRTSEWINGGEGYDQARTDDSGTGGVTLNMGTAHLERFRGGAGVDLVDASGVSESVSLEGGGGNDELIGSPNDDVINGGPGDDDLQGGGGDDRINGSDGVDAIDGGNGTDDRCRNAGSGSYTNCEIEDGVTV
jgi:Ca2+-binding RTX toxin-like protein